MSKKETEFDRFARKQKLEREAILEKRKDPSLTGSAAGKKKKKPKEDLGWNRRMSDLDYTFDEEYEYM